jgi:hypothetical protein
MQRATFGVGVLQRPRDNRGNQRLILARSNRSWSNEGPLHFTIPLWSDGKDPQSFQIVHVSGGTADIFRRARPLPLHTHGARHLRAGHDSFEDKGMLPTVPEIVLVPEHIPFIAEKFAQAPARSFHISVGWSGSGIPYSFSPNRVECRLIKGEWYIKYTYPSSFPFQSRSSHFFISAFVHFSRGFGLGLYQWEASTQT